MERVVQHGAAKFGPKGFDGSDVDADSQDVLGITGKRQQVERASIVIERDQDVDIARSGVFSARSGSDQTHLVGVPEHGCGKQLVPVRDDELAKRS